MKRCVELKHHWTPDSHCAQMPPAFRRDELVARLPYAFLVVAICAFLSGCSESAVVIAQTILHKARSTQSDVVVLVPKGSRVGASGCSDGWCWVKWKGQQGYALAKDLRTDPQRAATTEDREDDLKGDQDAGGEED
jgi:hypothetical protein